MNLIHLGQLHEHPGWGPTMTASIVTQVYCGLQKKANSMKICTTIYSIILLQEEKLKALFLILLTVFLLFTQFGLFGYPPRQHTNKCHMGSGGHLFIQNKTPFTFVTEQQKSKEMASKVSFIGLKSSVTKFLTPFYLFQKLYRGAPSNFANKSLRKN